MVKRMGVKKVFLIVLMGGWIVGCSSLDRSDNETQSENPNQPPQPTEVHFLSTSNYWWDEEIFMKEYGEPLQKKYPHIIPKTIPLSKINQAIMDGLIAQRQPIDIILAANYSYLVYVKAYNLHTDIEPLIKQANIDLKRFSPEFIEMNKQLGDGKLVGLPLQDSPAQILYNKGIFDKFGLKYPPHDQWTWENMFDLANRITRMDGGTHYYGVRIHSTYFRRNPFALEYIDPATQKAKFNSDLGRRTAEMYLRQYELSDEPGLRPDGAKMFFEDRVLAMWMPLGATYNTPERYEGLDWDLAPVPIMPELGNASVPPYPDYMYLSNTSRNKDLAMQAMEFLTSDEFQLQNSRKGFVTPLTNPQIIEAFGQDPELFKGKNVSAMRPKKYAPASSYDLFTHQAAATTIVKHVNTVRYRQADINTALRLAEEEVNQFIKDKLAAEAKQGAIGQDRE